MFIFTADNLEFSHYIDSGDSLSVLLHGERQTLEPEMKSGVSNRYTSLQTCVRDQSKDKSWKVSETREFHEAEAGEFVLIFSPTVTCPKPEETHIL